MDEDLSPLVLSASVSRTNLQAAGIALRNAFFGLHAAEITRSNATVFIKPDLGGPTLSARSGFTDPTLIAAVARFFIRAGAQVRVGDSPFGDGASVRQRWTDLGLSRLADSVGFELIDLEASETKATAVDDTVYYIPRPVIDADLVVNLPRLKEHDRFAVTGALTNLLGVLPGFQKTRQRLRPAENGESGRVFVDLYSVVQPCLTVLDMGESADQPGQTQLLISSDGVAIDVVVADRLGLRRPDTPHIQMASEAGLGIGWIEGIRYQGDEIRIVLREAPSFAWRGASWSRYWLSSVAEPWIWSRPRLNATWCGACGECVKNCPTKALRWMEKDRVPVVVEGICIACWHCSQICPNGAVEPEQSWLARLLATSERRTCVF